ncbi:MAG: adenine deaminase [Deltaproteobacteria bacterium]|nr:adenine deaminase [Deltaproteobacteria bacterium]
MLTAAHLTKDKDTKQLMAVALGQQKADLAVVNARLLNVYTGEILDNRAICTCGPWIAYVGKNPGESIGPGTTIIDAAGKTVIPGLIDGHTHLAWMATPDEFLKHIMVGGTTTLVTEVLEAYPVAGLDGTVELIESMQDQPIKCFCTAPAMVSISSQARKMRDEDLQALLERGDVLGLGETYWQALLQEPDLMLPRFRTTLLSGKRLEGHSAGASEKKLNAYIAAGVSSCHEPIKAHEVLDRLRLGIHVMVREGSIRRDLEEIAKIQVMGADLRRLILVTDGVHPVELLEKGYMEYVVQKAIDYGFEPVKAIQMATLNVAEHFCLDQVIGGIAPGRLADMLVIPDINTIKAETVISNGAIIAEHGKLCVSPRPHQWSPDSLGTVNLPEKAQASDFQVNIESMASEVNVRVIDLVTDLVTVEKKILLPVIDGKIAPILEQDIIKVAAVDRTHQPGKTFTGFLKGYGLRSGAFACSASWDAACIIVAGTNAGDMADAVNRVHELQGGAVIIDQGEAIGELALPVFGLSAELPMETIAIRLKALHRALADRGVGFHDPLLTLITLTGAAIPFLRICEEGLVTLKNGKTVDLVVR